MGEQYLNQKAFVDKVNQQRGQDGKKKIFSDPKEMEKMGVSREEAFHYFKQEVITSYENGTFKKGNIILYIYGNARSEFYNFYIVLI